MDSKKVTNGNNIKNLSRINTGLSLYVFKKKMKK